MPLESNAPTLTGGCQCGAVRYAIMAPPQETGVCHCRMCQKAVGGPFAVFASVRPEDFRWTRGEPGTFASSSLADRDFCRDCGTPLAYRGPSGRVSVSYGSLDQPDKVAPQLQFGIEGRRDWIDRLAKLPGSRTESGFTPHQLHTFVNRQHPDHDTAEGWTPPT